MPVQTTKKDFIYFPDGCQVGVKRPGDGTYFDVGAISTATTGVMNWDENVFETANAGKLEKQIRNMTIASDFTLINLDPEGVEKLSNGIISRVITAGTPVVAIDNQVISTGNWADRMPVDVNVIETGANALKDSASTLVVASVTASVSGVLAADDDYFLFQDSNSPSGWSIFFDTTGTATVALSEDITIAFTSITPVASTTLYAGTSTLVLVAYAIRFTHTDSNGKIRQLEIFSSEINSGGFAFNFKGANEDGVEEMPLSLTGKIDTDRTDNRQLMAWTVEAGAA